jgi:pyridinium-3,5-biscarboxylic acid mononucleotide synthase
MDADKIRQLLADVQQGKVDTNEAFNRLRSLPYEDLGFAHLDLHRSLRKGLPEVVLCQNKTPDQTITILERLAAHHSRVMGTRATPELARAVQEAIPAAKYNEIARIITISRADLPEPTAENPFAMVVSAGTSDMPVAEEAAITLEFSGDKVRRAYDVGVAGLHRLLDYFDELSTASVVISVAGMEGALTTVVGGLVACPVIGVPTSVGYGASFHGLAALLAMLNSCAPGVAVVNIDNGFGAAQFAHMILAGLKAR